MNCVSGTTQAKTQTSVIHGEHKSSSKPSLVVSPRRGATYDENILKEHLIIRCAHCLPDCESTYYTSSVSATPLRRWSFMVYLDDECQSLWWMLVFMTKNINLPMQFSWSRMNESFSCSGATQRTSVWRCFVSLTVMFLFRQFGRIRLNWYHHINFYTYLFGSPMSAETDDLLEDSSILADIGFY